MKCLLLMLTGAALLVGGIISGAMVSAVAAEPAIALVSKVILDVKRKEVNKDWVVAKRGETLASGDMVRTGDRSIAIIKFKDNSLVRVREKSEVTVIGTTAGPAFSKSIDLLRGTIGFSVKKQAAGEEFQFTSPTSVASIRGTAGVLTVGDTLTVTESRVRLKNKFSSREVDVDEGFTAFSYPDGTIQVRPSTAEEKAKATSVLREEGPDNTLELDFRDNQGNKKQLKINFK